MNKEPDNDSLDREVRFHIYDQCMREGLPPTLSGTASHLKRSQDEMRLSFQRLADGHILVLQKGTGEILMANPFSAVPTPFVVRTANQIYHGNCIWDALGIPAMLGQDATIQASCGCCNTAMNLTVRNGSVEESHGLAHFAIAATHWWDDIVFN
jgi:hypothetical protein